MGILCEDAISLVVGALVKKNKENLLFSTVTQHVVFIILTTTTQFMKSHIISKNVLQYK